MERPRNDRVPAHVHGRDHRARRLDAVRQRAARHHEHDVLRGVRLYWCAHHIHCLPRKLTSHLCGTLLRPGRQHVAAHPARAHPHHTGGKGLHGRQGLPRAADVDRPHVPLLMHGKTY